jgi:uncharacterized protein YjbI with pentapeptide repeats
MKKSLLFLLCLMVPVLTWAQSRVNAADIIAKINRGEAVVYKNVEITGDLDLTRLDNMKLEREPNNRFSTREYVSTVKVPVTFINCTFKGDVLAYVNPDGQNVRLFSNKDSNEVYNTNFTKAVRFEDCVFEGYSAFKYSRFKENVSFAGSTFHHEALFKYSKFSGDVDFSKARFKRDGNFKYATFPETANFSKTTFQRDADFKYAKFEQQADFGQATFRGLANFKYTKVNRHFNLSRAVFDGSEDFKYTQVNSRRVSKADLVN